MKRIISLFLSFIYLNTAFGVGIDAHICGDKIVDITVAGMGHARCDCLPGSMPPGCCRHVVCYCKTDHHKIPSISALVAEEYSIQAPALIPNYISQVFEGAYFEMPAPEGYYLLFAYARPIDLCLFHQVFRL